MPKVHRRDAPAFTAPVDDVYPGICFVTLPNGLKVGMHQVRLVRPVYHGEAGDGCYIEFSDGGQEFLEAENAHAMHHAARKLGFDQLAQTLPGEDLP